MNGFNLSEWALRHQALVRYFILVLAVVGVMAYQRLSQSEDPPFTFKVMVIRTLWPGATAREVEQQVTDRIEKKLQEAPYADIIRSYSKPGESNVFFLARDSTPPAEMPNVFYQVRKKIGDIRQTLPAGIQGPFFNDEFGDTLGNVYALIGDGYDYAALKHYADKVRDELLRVKDVAKVELIGEQDERIYVELSSTRLATLGIDLQTLLGALASQNAVAAAGSFETGFDRIYLRPGGAFDSVERIRELSIRAGGRLLRLGDIAEVKRGFADPPQPRMRFMGSDALGIGVSMAKGGDIIALGGHLDAAVARIQEQLPLGLELHAVASQPTAVARSINEFVRSLAEAVAIVLVVSFFSLGFRTGLVVALSIPLVLALTFFLMYLFGVGLHKISLGALILALGLLVDDAIIAVEMMAVKMEQGWDRVKAASFAYTSTAMPMLTGTLVTAAGFLPIATAASSTGEYTRSIFQVSVIALLISWFAAVIVIPYLGFRLLPDQHGKRGEPGVHEVYDSPFYRRFRQVVRWCVRYRKTVILVTLLAFALAVAGFRFVQEQFFPASTRLELLVDLRLAEGSSLPATEAQVKKLEALLAREKGIENFVAYVGSGSPRFYLPLDQQLPNGNFAQFVVLTRSLQDRERVRSWLIKLFEDDFTELRGVVQRLENGPPVGFPVQFRVSGEDIATVRKLAYEVAQVMRANRNLSNVQFDWDEQTKVIRLGIDQAKARVLGITSEELANVLNAALSGIRATVYRENDKQIDVLVRGTEVERMQLSYLRGSRHSDALGQIGGADADRRPRLRSGGGRDLAPQPAADDNSARQRLWRHPGTGGDRADQSPARSDPRQAAAGILPANRWRRRGECQGRRIGGGGGAAVRRHGGDHPDAAIAELLAYGAGSADGAAGDDRGDHLPARLRQTLRLRRHAGYDRPVRHDHAQLRDPGGSDRAGHRGRTGAVERHRRGHGAPLPAHHADRRRGDSGHGASVPQRFLRTDGGGHHGRSAGGDVADAAVPAGALRRVVPGARGGEFRTGRPAHLGRAVRANECGRPRRATGG